MPYPRLTSPLTWILTFFLLLFAYTKFAGPITFSIHSTSTTKSDTFSVTGTGKVIATPDTSTVIVGVTANGLTVKDAQNQLNVSANKVSEAIKKLGIDAKDIESVNYSITPNIDYRQSTQRITGYTASTSLQIKVKEIEKTNSVIDEATKSGANQVGGVNFEVGDKTKLDNLARVKAVSDAKSKAENAARVAGFRLGRIINYTENESGYPPFMSARTLQVTEKDSTASSTQVEPGSSEITVTVTLSYEII